MQAVDQQQLQQQDYTVSPVQNKAAAGKVDKDVNENTHADGKQDQSKFSPRYESGGELTKEVIGNNPPDGDEVDDDEDDVEPVALTDDNLFQAPMTHNEYGQHRP